jgi:hypothetical protein
MFDDDFGKDFDRDFSKQFAKTQRWVVVAFFAQAAIGIGVLAFVGWVIVKIMQHFGVL